MSTANQPIDLSQLGDAGSETMLMMNLMGGLVEILTRIETHLSYQSQALGLMAFGTDGQPGLMAAQLTELAEINKSLQSAAPMLEKIGAGPFAMLRGDKRG